jgi:hypothetical protein
VAEKFTKRVIDRLIAQADPGKDSLVWDSEVPGFVLRLRSGSARFAFQYKHRGRTKRVNLGAYGPLTLEQARDLARSHYVQLRAGTDPAKKGASIAPSGSPSPRCRRPTSPTCGTALLEE